MNINIVRLPKRLFEKEGRRIELTNVAPSDYDALWHLLLLLEHLAKKYHFVLTVQGGGAYQYERPIEWWHLSHGYELAMKLQGVELDATKSYWFDIISRECPM